MRYDGGIYLKDSADSSLLRDSDLKRDTLYQVAQYTTDTIKTTCGLYAWTSVIETGPERVSRIKREEKESKIREEKERKRIETLKVEYSSKINSFDNFKNFNIIAILIIALICVFFIDILNINNLLILCISVSASILVNIIFFNSLIYKNKSNLNKIL